MSANPDDKAKTELGTYLRFHTIENVDTAFELLAMSAGNYSRTCREMKEVWNVVVTPPTLKKWAEHSFPERYLKIQHSLSEKLDPLIQSKVSSITLRGTEIQGTVLETLDDQLKVEEINSKDLATIYNNISSATERNFKVKRLMEEKPTQIAEVRTVEQAIKELEDDDILVLDAEDITDAVVVSEDTPSESDDQQDQDDDDENPNDSHTTSSFF